MRFKFICLHIKFKLKRLDLTVIKKQNITIIVILIYRLLLK